MKRLAMFALCGTAMVTGCGSKVAVQGGVSSTTGSTAVATTTVLLLPSSTTEPTTATAPTTAEPALTTTSIMQGDLVTQGYWYCWDDGSGPPHHLGYPVSNDHLCTDAELAKFHWSH